MSTRYELGDAGGAARELEERRIFGVYVYVIQLFRRALARPLDQLRQRQKPIRRIAQDHSNPQGLAPIANSSDDISKIKVFGPVRSRACDGAGQLDELAHFAETMRRQRHNRDAADL